ncbi:uncharacterized protein BO97DRAFT_144237 [Aspergillus homomorphus CBS 101889]|uniref:Uncharacterized protein n=1 Tax=Aspergillus homomorphus (strain CBS 101889) TaxID=1450537 RepID=A0A395HRL9_ASPHC|nr:hypothetical protein BO97DRAFT_144237 [Aspergillus homomorphus CBS 101889]RAL10216.1 hypothetical protein BO97DRAFT_144237 [Aspergillus homomorphus CBS 101889]
MAPWLSNIYPVYGDHESEKPNEAIPVVDNKNGDINAGFGGKYVWLVANYFHDSEYGIAEIKVVISEDEKPGQLDLAKGAGGQYRYLETSTHGEYGISSLKLLRSGEEVTSENFKSQGFHGWSSDVNAGRGGDYLYLVWKK